MLMLYIFPSVMPEVTDTSVQQNNEMLDHVLQLGKIVCIISIRLIPN